MGEKGLEGAQEAIDERRQRAAEAARQQAELQGGHPATQPAQPSGPSAADVLLDVVDPLHIHDLL